MLILFFLFLICASFAMSYLKIKQYEHEFVFVICAALDNFKPQANRIKRLKKNSSPDVMTYPTNKNLPQHISDYPKLKGVICTQSRERTYN